VEALSDKQWLQQGQRPSWLKTALKTEAGLHWNYELKTKRKLISILQTLTNENAVPASDSAETDVVLVTKPSR